MRRKALEVFREYGWLLLSLSLFVAVSFLPPDTSLEQVKRRGVLTACVPPVALSTSSSSTIERRLLAAIAERMGLRLTLYEVPAMVQNFDPRDWGVNRAQCAILASGIADTPLTRAFMDVSPAYGEAGLVALSREERETIADLSVAVPVDLHGVDRLALSRYLRSKASAVMLVPNVEEAVALLQAGEVAAAIAPAQDVVEGSGDWTRVALPSPFNAHAQVFGLWKGDLTLKRAVARALAGLEADGTLDAIRAGN
jgi:ABC-type amino acid transport substrate-binding protein